MLFLTHLLLQLLLVFALLGTLVLLLTHLVTTNHLHTSRGKGASIFLTPTSAPAARTTVFLLSQELVVFVLLDSSLLSTTSIYLTTTKGIHQPTALFSTRWRQPNAMSLRGLTSAQMIEITTLDIFIEFLCLLKFLRGQRSAHWALLRCSRCQDIALTKRACIDGFEFTVSSVWTWHLHSRALSTDHV